MTDRGPLNGTEPLDQDRWARRLAQEDFTTPLVLEAGAGTGKTATLVNRVLAWTLGPGWDRADALWRDRPTDLDAPDADPQRRVASTALRRVVAITFTDAAAAEMAERVVAALRQLRAGERPVGFVPRDATLAARAGHLLGVADQLQVRTIHGFCRRLLVDHPFEAGLHPRFTVDADGRRVRLLVEETVREALPAAYGEPGDPAFLTLAGLGVGPVEIAEALVALIVAGREANDLDADPLAPDRSRALIDRLHVAIDQVLRLLERRLGGARRAKNARKLTDGLRQLLVRIEGRDEPISLLVLTKAIAETLPSALRAHLAGWSLGRFNATERDHLGADEPLLRQAAQRLSPLVAHAARLDPERLDAARRALLPLLAAVRQRMHAEGILVFEDLLRRAARLLRDQPTVAERVRQRIDQLLVDEFQDTDARQCDLIRCLAFEGGSAPRPGLFVVGDPKQSIYGWRSADLAAYESFVEAVLIAGGDRLPLVENFRSVPAVLDEVTRVIAPVMVRVPGIQPPFEPLVPSAAKRKDPGHAGPDQTVVEHWLSWEADAEPPPARGTASGTASAIEALALVRDLRRLRALGTCWRDVGVLVRATTDIEVYLGALREADIPFTVSHDRQYFRRREIIEATATVCAILAPDDPLALLAFLRSASVGVPDAALLPLWRHGLPLRWASLLDDDPEALATIDQIIDDAVEETPSVTGMAALTDWPASLRHAVATVGVLRQRFVHAPADVFVAELRRRLRIEVTEAARYLGPYRIANLQRFFVELLDDLEQHAGDRHAVLRLLRLRGAGGIDREEAPPPEADGDAVRVMTIHRAKGLQFEHVYLLQTHKKARPQGAPVVDVEDHDGQLELSLFGAPSPAWDRVLARRDEVAAAELVRTLYVALTRAARRLVMVGCRDVLPDVGLAGAVTHSQLLDHREGNGPDVGALLEAASAGRAVTSGPDGVLWRLPAIEQDLAAHPLASEADSSVPTSADLAPMARQLDARRDNARVRMTRPFGAAASGLGKLTPDVAASTPAPRSDDHETARAKRETRPPNVEDDPERDPRRRLAMAAGTLVHLVFEHVSLDGPLDEALAAQDAMMENAAASVISPTEADPAEATAALARARQVLKGFRAGSLRARFDALRTRIVARELPLVSPPDPTEPAGPVAFVAGTIDMIYLDADDQPVIVDYKTDPVVDGTPDERLGARYRAQAGLYAQALQTALGLERPPSVELWYVTAGRVVEPLAGREE